MKAWKYRPNTYDVNLVKRHDDNSAINTYPVEQSGGYYDQSDPKLR